MGSFGDHFGIIWGSFWNHVGIILGSFFDNRLIILGPFWNNFGMILGPCWDNLARHWGPFGDDFGTILGSFWDHSEIVSGALNGHKARISEINGQKNVKKASVVGYLTLMHSLRPLTNAKIKQKCNEMSP